MQKTTRVMQPGRKAPATSPANAAHARSDQFGPIRSYLRKAQRLRDEVGAMASALDVANPSGGFSSFGEQMVAITRASQDPSPSSIDPRLVRAPTGAGEVDPSAGGF